MLFLFLFFLLVSRLLLFLCHFYRLCHLLSFFFLRSLFHLRKWCLYFVSLSRLLVLLKFSLELLAVNNVRLELIIFTLDNVAVWVIVGHSFEELFELEGKRLFEALLLLFVYSLQLINKLGEVGTQEVNE